MGNETLQGALELLVLKTLERAPKDGMHGFGIAEHILAASNDLLRVEEGSLYPALHRMEQQDWIASTWGVTANKRRARYYRLRPAGRRELERQRAGWRQTAGAVTSFLEA
ncbi:MAG: PadR family transcriptional regulator [Acidobacteria bacterium]|nr:MAG: PadR family transcriptional regulator [Acidobacteriota bacterium]